jgi:hypothetical protein
MTRTGRHRVDGAQLVTSDAGGEAVAVRSLDRQGACVNVSPALVMAPMRLSEIFPDVLDRVEFR